MPTAPKWVVVNSRLRFVTKDINKELTFVSEYKRDFLTAGDKAEEGQITQ